MSTINKLLYLVRAKEEHFIFIEWDFYKKWNWLTSIIIRLNPNYVSCKIFRKNYKMHSNIVIVGLKWNGKNVKRRTTGFAKDFLEDNKKANCIYCNQKLNERNATADHIIPLSKGGNNCQVNLIACCMKCNNERGNMDFYEYLKLKNKKSDINLFI